MWVKVFKNGPSNICGRQPLKNLKWYGLLHNFNIFKGCLSQILLGQFLNTLTRMIHLLLQKPSPNLVDVILQYLIFEPISCHWSFFVPLGNRDVFRGYRETPVVWNVVNCCKRHIEARKTFIKVLSGLGTNVGSVIFIRVIFKWKVK